MATGFTALRQLRDIAAQRFAEGTVVSTSPNSCDSYLALDHWGRDEGSQAEGRAQAVAFKGGRATLHVENGTPYVPVSRLFLIKGSTDQRDKEI